VLEEIVAISMIFASKANRFKNPDFVSLTMSRQQQQKATRPLLSDETMS